MRSYIATSYEQYEMETQVKGAYDFDTLYQMVKDDSKLSKLADLLERAKETEQNPEHHPEPSAFHHIKAVTDRLSNSTYSIGEQEKNLHIDLPLAGFFHDMGKAVPGVTQLHPKKIDRTYNNKRYYQALGHEDESAKIVDEFAGWITSLGGDPETVRHLVKNHMRVGNYLDRKMRKRSKRQEMTRDPHIKPLIKFHRQDQGGEDPTPRTKLYEIERKTHWSSANGMKANVF